jgi:hypothetical protein
MARRKLAARTVSGPSSKLRRRALHFVSKREEQMLSAAGMSLSLMAMLALLPQPQDVPVSSVLCSSLGPELHDANAGWHLADGFFEEGRYVAAAREYYKIFRCGAWIPLDPEVSNQGQLKPFDAALRAAAGGQFAAAAWQLNGILRTLPRFGDARLLMGVFEWAAGKHSEARATWRATITAPYFVHPPDWHEVPFPVTEAKKFLRWSSKQ